MADRDLEEYTDLTQIAQEVAYSRRLCAKHGWPVIDVTRRSVEETAATIIKLFHEREVAGPGRRGPELRSASVWRAQAGGATVAVWPERFRPAATKPDAFICSMNVLT